MSRLIEMFRNRLRSLQWGVSYKIWSALTVFYQFLLIIGIWSHYYAFQKGGRWIVMHVIAMLAQAQETSTVYMLYWYVPLGLRPEGWIRLQIYPNSDYHWLRWKSCWERHSWEVWVEVCRRGFQTQNLFKTKIVHFAILLRESTLI